MGVGIGGGKQRSGGKVREERSVEGPPWVNEVCWCNLTTWRGEICSCFPIFKRRVKRARERAESWEILRESDSCNSWEGESWRG